jgi:hypothetical protein
MSSPGATAIPCPPWPTPGTCSRPAPPGATTSAIAWPTRTMLLTPRPSRRDRPRPLLGQRLHPGRRRPRRPPRHRPGPPPEPGPHRHASPLPAPRPGTPRLGPQRVRPGPAVRPPGGHPVLILPLAVGAQLRLSCPADNASLLRRRPARRLSWRLHPRAARRAGVRRRRLAPGARLPARRLAGPPLRPRGRRRPVIPIPLPTRMDGGPPCP